MNDALDLKMVGNAVDASAPGLAVADVAILFGSTLPGPSTRRTGASRRAGARGGADRQA